MYEPCGMPLTKYAKFPFNPVNWPFFYGWVVIVVGTLGILMSIPGQTIGVSTFTDSLIDVLSINRDQISLAYMVGTVLSSFLLTGAGKLYDTHGVRLVAGIGSFALGLSLIVLSQIDVIISAIGIVGDVCAYSYGHDCRFLFYSIFRSRCAHIGFKDDDDAVV